MIEINLNPAAPGRWKMSWRLSAAAVRQVLVGGIITLGVLTAWLMVMHQQYERNLSRLSAEWEHLQKPKEELDFYRNTIAMLEREQKGFQHLRAVGLQWAPRLNLLSDCVPDHLWFTALSVEPVEQKGRGKQAKPKGAKKPGGHDLPERKVRVLVSGMVLVAPENTTSPLAALVQAIRRHPDYPRLFDLVEIQSADRRKLGSVDVTEFTLLLEAKEP